MLSILQDYSFRRKLINPKISSAKSPNTSESLQNKKA